MTDNFVKITVFHGMGFLFAWGAQGFAIGQHESFVWALAV